MSTEVESFLKNASSDKLRSAVRGIRHENDNSIAVWIDNPIDGGSEVSVLARAAIMILEGKSYNPNDDVGLILSSVAQRDETREAAHFLQNSLRIPNDRGGHTSRKVTDIQIVPSGSDGDTHEVRVTLKLGSAA